MDLFAFAGQYMDLATLCMSCFAFDVFLNFLKLAASSSRLVRFTITPVSMLPREKTFKSSRENWLTSCRVLSVWKLSWEWERQKASESIRSTAISSSAARIFWLFQMSRLITDTLSKWPLKNNLSAITLVSKPPYCIRAVTASVVSESSRLPFPSLTRFLKSMHPLILSRLRPCWPRRRLNVVWRQRWKMREKLFFTSSLIFSVHTRQTSRHLLNPSSCCFVRTWSILRPWYLVSWRMWVFFFLSIWGLIDSRFCVKRTIFPWMLGHMPWTARIRCLSSGCFAPCIRDSTRYIPLIQMWVSFIILSNWMMSRSVQWPRMESLNFHLRCPHRARD